MTSANQAFLMTGGVLLLSFATIVVVWFADRLRRELLGGP